MENPQPVTRPMALLWEAKIEHARGNRAKAELWAKKALREDPDVVLIGAGFAVMAVVILGGMGAGFFAYKGKAREPVARSAA